MENTRIMMNHPRIPQSQKGFTLVELMVTLAVSILIAAALYATYLVQQRSYQYQSSVIEIQQSARTALDMLVMDLRLAGLDPDETAGAGIEIAEDGTIAFSVDANRDGVLGTTASNDDPEYYAFQLGTRTESGTTIPCLNRAAELKVSNSGNISSYTLEPMADFIEAIEFYYEFEDGTSATTTPSSSELDDIRSVKVSLIARSRFPVKKVADQETFNLLSGNTWKPTSADRYIRRLVTTQVDLRNMGL